MAFLNSMDQVQVRRTCIQCNGTGAIVADDSASTTVMGKEPATDEHPSGSQRPCDRCNGERYEYRWVRMTDVYKFISEETARQARARSPRPF